MPQMNKGGKYVFGWSEIKDDLTISVPEMAVNEYRIADDSKIFLISGSKKTGGFCVTDKKLLINSKLKHILEDNEKLREYKLESGEFIKYKGRLYCWVPFDKGIIQLNNRVLDELSLKIGDKLLSIRSSDIAFTLGVKGPLIEKAHSYNGKIELY